MGTLFGTQSLTVVSEPGFYAATMRSDKPQGRVLIRCWSPGRAGQPSGQGRGAPPPPVIVIALVTGSDLAELVL